MNPNTSGDSKIDTAFDFRCDAAGKDPDSHSLTLRRYHRALWSKPLPSGRLFGLSKAPDVYLLHRSELGQFALASDSIIPTYTRWKSMRHIVELFPPEHNDCFVRLSYTIGGMMLFPANKIDGKQTINRARGLNSKIADRFDLTLECIRRHYLGQTSPLAETLSRYGSFFALFDDFAGYVNFFLLQDLVTVDFSGVRFFAPFDDFASSPRPIDADAYAEYRSCSIAFIQARNRRIELNVTLLDAL